MTITALIGGCIAAGKSLKGSSSKIEPTAAKVMSVFSGVEVLIALVAIGLGLYKWHLNGSLSFITDKHAFIFIAAGATDIGIVALISSISMWRDPKNR